MTVPIRARGGLAAWLTFLVVAVVVLHGLGGRLAPPPLSGEGARLWLDQRQPADVAFAALRIVALGLAWYLLVVSVAALTARLTHLAGLVTALDVVTVPAVRRLVNAALGLSLVATTIPGLAAAGTPEPPPVETMRRLPDEGPPASAPATAPSTTTTSTATTSSTTPPPPRAPTSTAASTSTSTIPLPGAPAPAPTPPLASPLAPSHVPGPPATSGPGPVPGSWAVRPGDHFWAVAERVLTTVWGRAPADSEVDPYWRVLVDANRSRLQDPDNPDLLFPGQTLTVPPPPARPA